MNCARNAGIGYMKEWRGDGFTLPRRTFAAWTVKRKKPSRAHVRLRETGGLSVTQGAWHLARMPMAVGWSENAFNRCGPFMPTACWPLVGVAARAEMLPTVRQPWLWIASPGKAMDHIFRAADGWPPLTAIIRCAPITLSPRRLLARLYLP